MWDLTLPGYKYLGPGNPLDNGIPRNYDDWVAYFHDVGYGKIIEEGGNPYLQWSLADAQAFRQFSFRSYGGILGKAYFGLKKLAYSAGIISDFNPMEPQRKKLKIDKKRLRQVELETGNGIEKRIRIREIHEENDSLANSLRSTTMPDGEGSGKDHGSLKETPIDNPYVVYRGPPDFTFASLPYRNENLIYNFTDPYVTYDFAFRMTSPYDVTVSNTFLNDTNAGAGTAYTQNTTTDAADVTATKARWFDFYAGMYKYYHVVGCQYSIQLENLCGDPFWAYLLFHNDTTPPVAASNEDIQLWPNVKYHYLNPNYRGVVSSGQLEAQETVAGPNTESTAATGTTGNFETTNHVSWTGSRICTFKGEYHPGDFKREIILDSEVENWTLVTTNPTLTERLTLRIKPTSDAIDTNNASAYGRYLKIKMRVSLNYLVEFKELVDGLRWPVQRQPLTVTVGTDIEQ